MGIKLISILLISLTLVEVYSSTLTHQKKIKNVKQIRDRTFRIDYENDVFLMDGEPFQFVAGSFHYFRCPHQYWRQRLRTMRAAGLNAVTTYVEWSFHEPKYREYDWSGDKDLVKFIEIAAEEDLYVILRPGPYICAERDMGGFPYWLLNKYPSIKLRTSDENYKFEVDIWYSELMPKMQPYLYENGGPIIMVQVENEYGFYTACDKPYMAWLTELTENWVKGAAVLFTTDAPYSITLYCGSTPNAYTVVDFGANRKVSRSWNMMRKFSPHGPLVNSEFYPGWFTHWGEKAHTVEAADIVSSMEEMFEKNGSFNFYMFYGGTNFGFSAGANLAPNYRSDITSYDYDAPMTEAGDPTPKYMEIRSTIAKYMPLPDIPVPEVRPKGSYGSYQVNPILSMLGDEGKRRLAGKQETAQDPISFEGLDQHSGFVLYQTYINNDRSQSEMLKIRKIRDRGLAYLNGSYAGYFSRGKLKNNFNITKDQGNDLEVLVENLGRINSLIAADSKGMRDTSLNNNVISNWVSTGFPLESIEKSVEDLIPIKESKYIKNTKVRGFLQNGPVIYATKFTLDEGEPLDTYLDMTGWEKGIVWINDINLGRYWPSVGPQITLYVPGVYLNAAPKENTLIILELESAPENLTVEFINEAKLGYTYV